jgi:hypothetical protein
MSRKLAGIYAAGSTAFAVLTIMVASSVFGLLASTDPADAQAGAASGVTGVAVDVTPAYSSALGDLEKMRASALNDVAAQVAAQRAALQEQALREVQAQRAALQAEVVSSIEAQRAAAQQALAAQATPSRAPLAPTVATTASPTTVPAIVAATPSPTAAPRTVSLQGQTEVAQKSAECDRKRGEDRTECLQELAILKARYGL